VEKRIARPDKQAEAAESPFSRRIELPVSIPGSTDGRRRLAEIGHYVSRFPTPGHLIAWTVLCPGHNQSAGKRKRCRLRKGALWLKTMFTLLSDSKRFRRVFWSVRGGKGPARPKCKGRKSEPANRITKSRSVIASLWIAPVE
jgi:transposase